MHNIFYSRKFKYLCIDIQDIPNENILRYLPKAISFIESCVTQNENNKSNNNKSILVHCVYGQSRSCAMCIAYLMYISIRSLSPSYASSNKDLLSSCYLNLLEMRPCMAINPGFIRQLEIFRRMHCGIYKEQIRPIMSVINDKYYPPQSKAYATFRSFRFMKDYYNHNDSSKLLFHPMLPQNKECLKAWVVQICNKKYEEVSSNAFYCCNKCRCVLFSNWNTPYLHNTLNEISKLPSSPYWEESEGGKIASATSYFQSKKNKENGMMNYNNYYALEPMEWMKSSGLTNSFTAVSKKEKLSCPKCKLKIGVIYDWSADYFVFVFVHKSIVDSFTVCV